MVKGGARRAHVAPSETVRVAAQGEGCLLVSALRM